MYLYKKLERLYGSAIRLGFHGQDQSSIPEVGEKLVFLHLLGHLFFLLFRSLTAWSIVLAVTSGVTTEGIS